jgi:hypothetical protein
MNMGFQFGLFEVLREKLLACLTLKSGMQAGSEGLNGLVNPVTGR